MNLFDHYAATRELISQLEDNGYETEADILRAAMEQGATGTEVFMALRFHLNEVINEVSSVKNPDISLLASRLLSELNAALK